MTGPTPSPIKDEPLRLPGQSLDEQRRELLTDKREPWLLFAAFLARQPRTLEPKDIKRASFQLSRYVRSGERERK